MGHRKRSLLCEEHTMSRSTQCCYRAFRAEEMETSSTRVGTIVISLLFLIHICFITLLYFNSLLLCTEELFYPESQQSWPEWWVFIQWLHTIKSTNTKSCTLLFRAGSILSSSYINIKIGPHSSRQKSYFNPILMLFFLWRTCHILLKA